MNFSTETCIPALILENAADILERDGWVRHSLHAPNGSHCALGSLLVAQNELESSPEGWYWVAASHREDAEAVFQQIVSEKQGYPVSISRWNDYFARDRKMVVRALRRAAKRACGGKA